MNDKDKIYKFQLDHLFKRVVSISLTSTIIACYLAYLLRNNVSQRVLYGWLFSLVVLKLIRIGLKFKYEYNYRANYKKTLNWYRLLTIMTGLLWGSISIVAINSVGVEDKALYTLILIGIASGGSIANLGDKKASTAYVLAVVIPYMIKSYFEHSEGYTSELTVISIFTLLFLNLITIFNSQLLEMFKLTIDKENLLKELENKHEIEIELKEKKLHSIQASKLASLGEMAAGVAHEVNNPLQIVSGYLWLLNRDLKEDDRMKELAQKSLEGCKRISRIVESMKSLSRIENPEELESLQVTDIIKTMGPLLERDLKESGVELVNLVQNELIKGHLSDLTQVLYNLVINGIHALIEEDIASPRITISSKEDKHFYYLEVCDNGKGVPTSLHTKIFEPFFTTKAVGKGTGLGLSLCRSIMERIGGDLTYTNYKVSTFTLKILKDERSIDNSLAA